MDNKSSITVGANVEAPVGLVWKLWTHPDDVLHWNAASADWHTTKAENDLKEGGAFSYRMEARDGSFGFDFSGVYDKIITNELIEYTLGDNRKVRIIFSSSTGQTMIAETFEAETTHPVELQQAGWQAILNNFKLYAETRG